MPIDRINIDVNAAGATEAQFLKSLVADMRSVYERLGRVKAKMGRLNDGTNFTGIVGPFGLPAGTGQTVFDLVNGALGSTEAQFQVDDFREMTERLG